MKKVWIVDDDQETTDAVELMLKLIGCESLGFADARSTAQALLSGQKPDLMLLDINLPEVSGMDLLEFMRRRPDWNELPIVMLSTEAADVTVDRAMSLGADGYITKPVTIDELEKSMDLALQRHQKANT